MRAGLLVKVAFGILSRIYWVNVSGISGRGRVVEDHGSFGPGTKMNWQWEASRGYSRIAAPRALNPAVMHRQIDQSRGSFQAARHIPEYVSMSSAPVQPFVEKSPQKMKAYGRNSAWEYPANTFRRFGSVFG